MVITYRTSDKIRFPVFKIPSDNWSRSDGLLFLDNKILDDKNIQANTLGERRLQSPLKNQIPLRYMIHDLAGILKQRTFNFIDSNGTPFIYEKTMFARLKYRKIKEIKKKGTASLLYVYKIIQPFIIPRPPEEGITHAGILHLSDSPWILYEYADRQKKDTRRKI